jgi:acyl dehydratase
VDRTTLALFAGASGDHNPIHIDLDFARRAGMPDVFAQGMLGMAWLGRLLTRWVPQARLRRFDVRFQGITHLGHVITCRGTRGGKIRVGRRALRARGAQQAPTSTASQDRRRGLVALGLIRTSPPT